MSNLNEKFKGIMKSRKDKTQRRGSLLNPNNERKFDSDSLLETLKEIEEEKKEKKEDKGSSSMDTGKGRKKTRKKKSKERKTKKRKTKKRKTKKRCK